MIARPASAVGEATRGGLRRRPRPTRGPRGRSSAGRRRRDELGMVFAEDDVCCVSAPPARDGCRRPTRLPALDIAQEDEGALVVAGGILAPARHRDVAPAAVAGAGGGQHHRIAAVRQQMRDRRGTVVPAQAPHRRRRPDDRRPAAASSPPRPAAARSTTSRGMRSCSSSSRRLDHRLAVEPRAHAAVVQARWRCATIVMPW